MSRARRCAPLIAIFALAGTAVTASAYEQSATIGWREIAVMEAEEQLDLSLAHLASRGEWVGRNRPSARGPLWQGAMRLATLGGPRDPSTLVFARQLVFPLLSLGLALCLVLRMSATRWGRVAVAAVVLPWALHVPEETAWGLTHVLGLLIFCPADGRDVRPTQRGAWAGIPVAIAGGFAPSILAEGAVVFATAALVSVSFVGWRVAAARLGGALLALGGGAATMLAFAWPEVTLPWAAMDWPSVAVSPSRGLLALVAVVVAFAGYAAFKRAHGVVWVAGVLPIAVIGVLADSDYLVATPIALAVLALVASSVRAHPAFGTAGALLVVVAFLGWGGESRRGSAWHPRVFAWAASAALGERRPKPETGDDHAIYVALRHRDGCVVAPADFALAWTMSGADGPLEAPLAPEQWAPAIRRRGCPWAILRSGALDRPGATRSAANPSAMLELAARYEPAEQLGPALYLGVSRPPRRIRRRALRLRPSLPRSSVLQGSQSLRFSIEEPLSTEALLELALELEGIGVPSSPPTVTFLRGEAPVGSPTVLPVTGGSRVRLPLDRWRAEGRWLLGQESEDPSTIDGFALRFRGDGAWRVRILGALAALPPPVAPREPSVETPPFALATRRRFERHTLAGQEGEDLTLETNSEGVPTAAIFFPVTPPEGACLVGEVGLVSGTGESVGLEIDVIDGTTHTRRIDWRITEGWRRPFVLPLRARRALLIRVAVSSAGVGGERVNLVRPRVVSCGQRRSLVHALHDGAHRVVRGEVSMVGDTLSLRALPRGRPPTEVRLEHFVREGDCLSLELRGRSERGPVAVAVGAVHRGRLHRLVREVYGPDDDRPQRSFRDLPLGEWAGDDVLLHFAVWPMETRTRGGLGEVVRPQIHTCGERPDWHF